METLKETNNKLLKRKEVIVKEKYDSNPGFAKATQDIATKFKAQEEAIAIKKINSKFGTNNFEIEAFIYNTVEDKAKIEPKPKEKKK